MSMSWQNADLCEKEWKQGEELECSPLAAPQPHSREHSDSPTAVWAVREWRPHSTAALWTWPSAGTLPGVAVPEGQQASPSQSQS